MSASPVFIDTNILVYANLALSPWHAQAVQRLTTLDAEGTPCGSVGKSCGST